MRNLHLGWALFALFGVLAVFSYMFHVRTPKPSELHTPLPGVSVGPDDRLPGGDYNPHTSTPTPPLVGRSTTFSGADPGGKTTWELHATSVDLKDDQKRVQAHDVECTFFNEKKLPVATMLAKGAVMNMNNQNLFFIGPVTATTPTRDRMLVHKLQYDGSQKKFFGSGGIKVTRGTSVLTGDQMVADPALQVVTVKGHVRAFIHSLAALAPPAAGGPSGSIQETASPSPSGAPAAQP